MRNAHRSIGMMVICVVLLGVGFAAAEDWPQWRGANRDGMESREVVRRYRQRDGCILAGNLNGHKSRLLLMLGIAKYGNDVKALRNLFKIYN